MLHQYHINSHIILREALVVLQHAQCLVVLEEHAIALTIYIFLLGDYGDSCHFYVTIHANWNNNSLRRETDISFLFVRHKRLGRIGFP